MTYLANPAIQLIALFIIAGLIFFVATYLTIRAYLKLKTKSKSLSEIAEDGKRVILRLERYSKNLPDEQELL